MTHVSLLSKLVHEVKCGETLSLKSASYMYAPFNEYTISFQTGVGTIGVREDMFVLEPGKQEGASAIMEYVYTFNKPGHCTFTINKLYGENKILWSRNIDVIVVGEGEEGDEKELETVVIS